MEMFKSKDSTEQSGRGISTQLAIPHKHDPNINLVGILQQVELGESTIGRNIALVRIQYFRFQSFRSYRPLLSMIDSAWNVRVRREPDQSNSLPIFPS